MKNSNPEYIFPEPLSLLVLKKILQSKCWSNFSCILRAIFLYLFENERPCLRREIDSISLFQSYLQCFLLKSQEKGVEDLHKKGCRIYDRRFYLKGFLHKLFQKQFCALGNLFFVKHNVHIHLKKDHYSTSSNVRTIFLNHGLSLWIYRQTFFARISQYLRGLIKSWTNHIMDHVLSQEDDLRYA